MEGEWGVIFFSFSLVVLVGREEEEEERGRGKWDFGPVELNKSGLTIFGMAVL